MSETAVETASWGRRILALLVDWAVSSLAVVAFLGVDGYADPPGNWIVLGVYVVESALFTWLLGGSFGKLVTGLRTVPADGVLHPISPVVLLVRQALIALVIPPLVFRHDGRGLHDLFARTATVKREVFDAMVAKARAGR